MNNSMFDTLLLLPLFQGLALEDLTSILGKVKLHFRKHKPGETIIKAGDECDCFVFVLRGEVASTTAATDGSFSLTDYLPAPHLIEPQSLFGMTTAYRSTHEAVDEVHTLTVAKRFVLDELCKYEIFRLNYMNLLSNRAQQLGKRIWSHPGTSSEERIAHFIRTHCKRPTGKKVLKIKMDTLASYINEGRVTVSKALNHLQDRGLLSLSRGGITVPRVENLPV